MRILVTGGAGFLGSNMVESLLKQGHAVTCLDNFMTGSERNLPTGHASLRVVRHDTIHPFPFDPVRNEEDRFDQIYHMACPASPPAYQRDPIHTAKTCFLGTLHALELCWVIGPHCKVLLTSTSEVYGDPEVHPQVEEYRGNVSCTGPRACYDEGKRIAETLMFDARRTRGTEIRVARIFNTYGPRMAPDDGRVVSNFIMQALRNEDITIYGSGMQTRSYCYVDDQIRGLQSLMNNDKGEIGPVNIGNPVEYTVKETAEIVLRMLPDSMSKLVLRDLPVDDPKQRRPNIAKAKAIIGWEPQVMLQEGLERTIPYFRTFAQ